MFIAWSSAMASRTIVRNLSMRNTRPFLPTRGCANSTGRPLSSEDPRSRSPRAAGLNTISATEREHAVERVLDADGVRFAGERGHGRIIAAVRVAIVDPASTTPPYDHSLASALARRGPHRRSAHFSLSVRARSRAGRLSPRRALPAGQREDTRAQPALALALPRQGARVPAERPPPVATPPGARAGRRARAVARPAAPRRALAAERRRRDADRFHGSPRAPAGQRRERRVAPPRLRRWSSA